MVVRKCDICGKILKEENEYFTLRVTQLEERITDTGYKHHINNPVSEHDLCPICMDTTNAYIELMKSLANSQN